MTEVPNTKRGLLYLILGLQISIIILFVLWVTGILIPAKDNSQSLQTNFQRAIYDAALNIPDRVPDLFALNKENVSLQWQDKDGVNYVKAVAWMNQASFDKFYVGKSEATAPLEKYAVIWVTLVPQIQDFCKAISLENPTLRIKQYLGLDPSRSYDRFMEIWVKPEDLFRPCPDPEPTDSECNLEINPEKPPKVDGIDNYLKFYSTLERNSYRPDGAPWTGLGFTYDWAYGEYGFGASEYIIEPESSFLIEGNYATTDYCD